MNGKKAKKLRKKAHILTIAYGVEEDMLAFSLTKRKVYKGLKKRGSVL